MCVMCSEKIPQRWCFASTLDVRLNGDDSFSIVGEANWGDRAKKLLGQCQHLNVQLQYLVLSLYFILFFGRALASPSLLM